MNARFSEHEKRHEAFMEWWWKEYRKPPVPEHVDIIELEWGRLDVDEKLDAYREYVWHGGWE